MASPGRSSSRSTGQAAPERAAQQISHAARCGRASKAPFAGEAHALAGSDTHVCIRQEPGMISRKGIESGGTAAAYFDKAFQQDGTAAISTTTTSTSRPLHAGRAAAHRFWASRESL